MKQTVKKIFTLLILMVFFVYTTGLMITVHHCCRAHHHSAQDHQHCSENTYIFKITSQYTKTSIRHVENVLPLILFLNHDASRIGSPEYLFTKIGQGFIRGPRHIFKNHIYQLISHLLL